MNEDISDESQVENRQLFKNISEVWRDPPDELNSSNEEMQAPEMASLGNILLGKLNDSSDQDENEPDSRLSLSHKRLDQMPKIICSQFGYYIKTLDISNNQFRNLDFLEHFKELTSLIVDRNPINVEETNIPWMPKLELLYLNFCNIDKPFWVESLKYNCPNLRYLSLMGNPVAPSALNGGSIYEYLRYRYYVISIMTNLVHLDDKFITKDERKQAKKMYPTPPFQDLLQTTKVRIPRYFRSLTVKMSDYFSAKTRGQSSSQGHNVVI